MKFRFISTAVSALCCISLMSVMSTAVFAESADTREFTEADGTGFTLAGSAGWGGGQWLAGSDEKTFENPLTIADLEKESYIEIKYTLDGEIPPTNTPGDTAKLTFCYKFVTAEDADGKPSAWEAYLPTSWIQYGPKDDKGNTYASLDYFSYDIKDSDTLIIKTSDILNSLKVDKSKVLYLCQFGIGNNSYDYDSDWTDENSADYNIVVSSVKLIQGAAPVTEAEVTTAAEPEATTELTTEITTAQTTAVTEEVTTQGALSNTSSANENNPDNNTIVIVISVIAGIAIIAVIVAVVIKKKQ